MVKKEAPPLQDMTLADWYATFALQALINETGLALDEFAATSYDIAEKMIEERNKRWINSTTGQPT